MSRHRASRALLSVLFAPCCLHACTGFSSVRSAEVRPGGSIDAAVAVATPPGDAAAWFWALDCAVGCDQSIVALDLSYTRGIVPQGGPPFEIGVGVSGFYAYGHTYVQLGRGTGPWGVGGRLAAGPGDWFEVAAHLRKDVPLGRRTRLLLVPTFFAHWGSSPNGANPGRMLAVGQGIGLESRANFALTPYALLLAGRVDRTSYGRPLRASSVFAVLGVSMRFGN